MGGIFFGAEATATIVGAFNFLLDNKLGFYGRDKPFNYMAEIYDNDNIYSTHSTVDGKYQLLFAGNKARTSAFYIIANGTIIKVEPTIRYFTDEYGDYFSFCSDFDPAYTSFNPCTDNKEDEYRKEFKIHLKKWKYKDVVSEYYEEKENPEDEDQYIYIAFSTDIFGVNIYDIQDRYERCIYKYDIDTIVQHISSDDEYLYMTIYTMLERLIDDTATPEMFNMQVVEE